MWWLCIIMAIVCCWLWVIVLNCFVWKVLRVLIVFKRGVFRLWVRVEIKFFCILVS